FSSRRRHTRFSRDWSSDVCSSDLLELRREGDVLGGTQSGRRSSLKLLRVIEDAEVIAQARTVAEGLLDADPPLAAHEALRAAVRSEERRVGKEYRSRRCSSG